jgi:hypothetical protein
MVLHSRRWQGLVTMTEIGPLRPLPFALEGVRDAPKDGRSVSTAAALMRGVTEVGCQTVLGLEWTSANQGPFGGFGCHMRPLGAREVDIGQMK